MSENKYNLIIFFSGLVISSSIFEAYVFTSILGAKGDRLMMFVFIMVVCRNFGIIFSIKILVKELRKLSDSVKILEMKSSGKGNDSSRQAD